MRIPIPRGGSGRRMGGGSLLFIVAAGLLLWAVAGVNPLQFLDALSRSDGVVVGDAGRSAPPAGPGIDDQERAFLGVVLADTEDTWGTIFQDAGGTYRPPTLVLFSGQSSSGCGFASAAVGPFYCPNDSNVYLDTAFFGELAQRFGAPGDFAAAYVLAHEVGHHVQNLTGTLGRYHEARRTLSEREANALSVRVELQADCYAGVFAHHVGAEGYLEPGDIEEALAAASAVGDDTIQRRSRGHVVPDSFTHGSAAQRSQWFRAGYDSGDPDACDTFAAR